MNDLEKHFPCWDTTAEKILKFISLEYNDDLFDNLFNLYKSTMFCGYFEGVITHLNEEEYEALPQCKKDFYIRSRLWFSIERPNYKYFEYTPPEVNEAIRLAKL